LRPVWIRHRRGVRDSRKLRRDRELAFYGSEDVTPSTFYTRGDAEEARAMAEEVFSALDPLFGAAPSPAEETGAGSEDAASAVSGARRKGEEPVDR
jgi:hypothetical protein